jgi:hypothetical protein
MQRIEVGGGASIHLISEMTSHLAGRESSRGRTTTACSWPPAAEERMGPNRTGATTGRTSAGRRPGCGVGWGGTGSGDEWIGPCPTRDPRRCAVAAERRGCKATPCESRMTVATVKSIELDSQESDEARLWTTKSPSSVTLNQFHRLPISILSKMNTVCQSKYVVAPSGTFHSRLELVMLARTAVPSGAPAAVRAMGHR